MSSNLRVNNILPSVGTNVAIGTAGGSITLTGGVTGSSIINTGVTTVAAGSTSAPSISPSGDSNTGIFFPSADTVAIAEGGVEALRIDSSGRVGINSNSPNDFQVDISAPSDRPPLRIYRQRNTSGGVLLDIRSDVGAINTREFVFASGGDLTLSTGNLVIGTAGKGIDFSATANSSGTMTSELLDDYEVGTWTPVYRQGNSSGTAFTVSGGTQYARYVKVGKLVLVNFGFTNSTVSGSANYMYITGLPFTMWSTGIESLRSIGTPILYIGGFNTTSNVTLFAENTYMLVLAQGTTSWSLPTYTPTSGSYFHCSFTYEADS